MLIVGSGSTILGFFEVRLFVCFVFNYRSLSYCFDFSNWIMVNWNLICPHLPFLSSKLFHACDYLKIKIVSKLENCISMLDNCSLA